MRIFIFITMVMMAGVVGYVSKYTIADWQYWITVFPVCAWIGFSSGALAEYYS